MSVAKKNNSNVSKRVQNLQFEKVLAYVDNLTPEVLTENTEAVRREISAAVDSMNAAMCDKFGQYVKLREAVQAQESRLEELFKVDQTLLAIDIAKEEFDKITKDLDLKKSNQDEKIIEQWDEFQKKLQRAKEDEEYKHNQQMMKWRNEFDTSVILEKQREAIRKEKLEEDWLKREQQLDARQKEIDTTLSTLQNAVPRDEFDDTVEEMETKHAFELEKVRLELKTQQELSTQRENANNHTIQLLREEVKNLRDQIQSAEDRNTHIVRAALESSSGRAALDAVQADRVVKKS